MDEKEYEDLYTTIGVKPALRCENYDPNTFGYQLMQDSDKRHRVTYSYGVTNPISDSAVAYRVY